MVLYDIPNMTTGLDQVLIGTATTVPIFIPMFLLFVFGIVFMGGITSQKRRIGSADIPMWATISSLSTLMVSLPLTLAIGLIQLEVLALIVVLTVMSGVWLFLDRNRNEV